MRLGVCLGVEPALRRRFGGGWHQTVKLQPICNEDIGTALRELDQERRQEAGDIPCEHPGLLSRFWPDLQTLRCRTMLIEDEVLDEEYFREYLTFYATTFIEHPPVATRLHFFRAEADLVTRALDPLTGELTASEEKDPGYLGYVVLRPSSPSTVGETLLRIPHELRGERCYCHCATRFGQTVNGKRLHVPSAPFIGQDETGVCAQAAIWGACKYLHKYRYYPKVSLPDVTLMAGRQVAETLFTRPADGLSRTAICDVLRQLGFQVYLADARPGTPGLDSPLEAAYTAVESGLPAFLLLKPGDPESPAPGHAVWVTGHTFAPGTDVEKAALEEVGELGKSVQYLSASRWVGHLLVHDDNRGPYLPTVIEEDRMEVPEHDGGGIVSRYYLPRYSPYADPDPWPDHHPDEPRIVSVAQVVVPLPEEVFVKPPDARRMAVCAILGGHLASNLQRLDDWFQQGLVGWAPESSTRSCIAALQPGTRRYALRTFLCMSARFREYVVGSGMCDELKVLYAQDMRLPEYVWITEISDTQHMASEESHDARVVGELIIDSTDSAALRTSDGFRYLALHVPGLLLLRPGLREGEPRALLEPVGYDTATRRASRQPVGYDAFKLLSDTRYRPYSHHSGAADDPRSYRKLGPIHMPL